VRGTSGKIVGQRVAPRLSREASALWAVMSGRRQVGKCGGQGMHEMGGAQASAEALVVRAKDTRRMNTGSPGGTYIAADQEEHIDSSRPGGTYIAADQGAHT